MMSDIEYGGCYMQFAQKFIIGRFYCACLDAMGVGLVNVR